jgi:hypothetical protein
VSLTCLALKPTAVVWRNEPEKLEGDLAGDGGRCIPTHVGVRGAIVSITLRARLWLSRITIGRGRICSKEVEVNHPVSACTFLLLVAWAREAYHWSPHRSNCSRQGVPHPTTQH